MHTDPRGTVEAGNDALRAVAAELAARPYARRGVSAREVPLRVILADDHAVFRAGIRSLLASTPDVQVVGEAASGPEAVRQAVQHAPDLVLLDLDMPGGSGEDATRAISALEHPPKVLILTMHVEEERLLPLLELGASGYLAKDAAERELVEAIRVVAIGETYVRPRVARLLATTFRERHRPDGPRQRFEALSIREQAVVRMIAEGYNGPEIGKQLGISPKTVDTYKQRIEEKLGLTHRTQYVRFALRIGLLVSTSEQEMPGR